MQTTPESHDENLLFQTHSGFLWLFAIIVMIVNLVAVGAALADASWGALQIALLFGPIANVLLALGGLVAIPSQQCKPSFSMTSHLVLSLGLPASAIVGDLVLIFMMQLHGG